MTKTDQWVRKQVKLSSEEETSWGRASMKEAVNWTLKEG